MFTSSFLPEKLNFKPISYKNCQSCALGKFAKFPFDSSTTQVDAPFHLLHCDLWGPSLVLFKLGNKYFVLFIDQFSRYTWVYFLQVKSERANIAKNFITMIDTKFGKRIKIFRSDPGGEF